MAKTMDYLCNYPFKKGDEKKPKLMRKEELYHYLYTPEKPYQSDLNWMYCSTEEISVGAYQLAPGSTFEPVDVHAGDEYYYMLEGTLTLLNPDTGEAMEAHRGDAVVLPKGVPHKTYNFTNEPAVMLWIIVPLIWTEEGPPLSYDKPMKLLKFGQ